MRKKKMLSPAARKQKLTEQGFTSNKQRRQRAAKNKKSLKDIICIPELYISLMRCLSLIDQENFNRMNKNLFKPLRKKNVGIDLYRIMIHHLYMNCGCGEHKYGRLTKCESECFQTCHLLNRFTNETIIFASTEYYHQKQMLAEHVKIKKLKWIYRDYLVMARFGIGIIFVKC